MGYSKTIALLAGAAMGLTTSAQAQTQDQARAYNAEALADAGGRTSTLASTNVTGPEISGQIQFRYILNFRDDTALANEMTNGFQTRRTKLEAKGEIADGWSYFVQIAANRDGGGVGLEEGWVKYAISETSNLTWGQFKAPGLREELVSSKRQLAAERSVMNEVFTQDRSQGVQYDWNSENTRFTVAFTDGLDSENTDILSGSEADWAFSGRFEYMGAGDWKQFADFTSFRGSAFAWMIGGAAHYQSGGDTNGTTDLDLFQFTVDGSVEGDGWNAFAAFVYRMLDVAGGLDTDDLAFLVQGGYFLDPQWEIFGRADFIMPDTYGVGIDEDFTTVTVGVNHYVIPDSHAAKFTADVVYFVDAQSESSALVSPDTGTGLLASGEDGQFALRFQFQLLF